MIGAQHEQKMLLQEMRELSSYADDAARKVKDLEAKAALLESRGSSAAAKELREEALKHRAEIAKAANQMKSHAGKFAGSRQRVTKALGKLQGKFLQSVGKAMEKKMVRFVATKLMKLVPIVNLVSTIVDVIELVGLIKNLIDGTSGDGDGGGGDEETKTEHKGLNSTRSFSPVQTGLTHWSWPF